MKKFLKIFDILTFPKEDLDLAEVRFTGEVLYYNDGNHTRSIFVTKERLIEIIDKYKICGNGHDLFFRQIETNLHFKDLQLILIDVLLNELRTNVIDLSNSKPDEFNKMIEILKENEEPIHANVFYRSMVENFENQVFRFDFSMNKWCRFANSTIEPNITISEFVKKHENSSLERLFELQNILAGYKESSIDRNTLLKEEKELLLKFKKVAPTFNDLVFRDMDKIKGQKAILELQRNTTIQVILSDVFMSNGIDNYEVAINKNGVLSTLEYQTKEDVEDFLSYELQYKASYKSIGIE